MRNHFLDLTKYAFKRELGEFDVYGTWVGMTDEDIEPAIVIVTAHRSCRPVCVALSAAYKYNDPSYLARAADIFCQDLGLTPGLKNTVRIGEMIHSHLLDLIKMPPVPVDTVQVGEGFITHGDGRKETCALLDYEIAKD
jgi:hypothetical protein